MMRLVIAMAMATAVAPLRDDGRFQNNPLHGWFMTLRSEIGYCCAEADGIPDPDWRAHEGHYQVFLRGEWVNVPDRAVIKGPNLTKTTWVWPIWGDPTTIRCFLPGTMT